MLLTYLWKITYFFEIDRRFLTITVNSSYNHINVNIIVNVKNKMEVKK